MCRVSGSKYYMREWPEPARNITRPGCKQKSNVNYWDSPSSKEDIDSDYEPTPRQNKPLDNKKYPSNEWIAIPKQLRKIGD